MSLSSLSLLLGAIGTAVAVGNQIHGWVEKRRVGKVADVRLDLEGLTTLVREQREELDDARTARREDHARIDELTDEVADLRKLLRKAEDTIDRLTIALELKR